MTTKGQLARDKILAETTNLVRQKGFGQTSINDILEATGLKKGSLYFHYSDKNAIALAVLDKATADFLSFLDNALSGDSPGEALNSFFNEVLQLHRGTDFIGGCLFGNTALEMGDTSSEIAERIDIVFQKWTAKLQKVVSAAQKTQEIRSDLSPKMLANQIIATIEGGIMLSRLRKTKSLCALLSTHYAYLLTLEHFKDEMPCERIEIINLGDTFCG